MKIKAFFKKWHSWGFELSFCIPSKSISIGFIKWHLTLEYWSKEDVKRSQDTEIFLKEFLESVIEESKSKPAKKKAAKKKPAKKK